MDVLIFYSLSLQSFPPVQECVIPAHMLLLLILPPGQLSWENTEAGSNISQGQILAFGPLTPTTPCHATPPRGHLALRKRQSRAQTMFSMYVYAKVIQTPEFGIWPASDS